MSENKKKMFFIWLLVLISTFNISSNISSNPGSIHANSSPVTAAGKITIPGAVENRSFAARFQVNAAGLEIICMKKIFRPFNDFNAAYRSSLLITAADLMEIALRKKDFLIFTSSGFYKKHRNLFHETLEFKGYYGGAFHSKERQAIIITVDDAAARKTILAALKTLCEVLQQKASLNPPSNKHAA